MVYEKLQKKTHSEARTKPLPKARRDSSSSFSSSQSILKKRSSFGSSSELSNVQKVNEPNRRNSSLSFSPKPNTVFLVPKLPVEALDACFYDDNDIAEFRYDAYMEEIGLDPEDFE